MTSTTDATVRDRLRSVYACFPSGVAAVCATVDGVPVGLAASSFTSVSMNPPLVSVCMQATSTTWPRLRGLERLGVSVLAEGQEGVCNRLASKTGDRFAFTSWSTTPDGGLYVDGATAWLDCSVHDEIVAGDHTVVLLRIHGIWADPDVPPLVFHGSQFRRLAGL
ncbi:MAG: flavin reductase family protein [Aeromicrobium sp.]